MVLGEGRTGWTTFSTLVIVRSVENEVWTGKSDMSADGSIEGSGRVKVICDMSGAGPERVSMGIGIERGMDVAAPTTTVLTATVAGSMSCGKMADMGDGMWGTGIGSEEEEIMDGNGFCWSLEGNC